MIKAVIFDCFGVLTLDGWLKFCDTFFGTSEKREVARQLNQEVDRGKTSYRDFLNEVASLAGVSYDEAQARIMEPQPKNDALLSYIRNLKSKSSLKTAILSNAANPAWFKQYFSQDELALFDQLIISSQEGIIKPDPEIFQISAQRLGVETNECLFIDDQQRNIDAAKEQGMTAILYENLPKLKRDLTSLLPTVANN